MNEKENNIELIGVTSKDFEFKEERKQNRKIDISLILSAAALLITLVQFVVSSPFFIDYYYKSSYTIEEMDPLVSDTDYITMYAISNRSNNTVNNVDIGISILSGDAISIYPNRNIQNVFKENGPKFKDCFITIDKLLPNETIIVQVQSKLDSVIYYNTSFLKKVGLIKNETTCDTNIYTKEKENVNLTFPQIMFARHEKGFANITLLSRERIFNIENVRAKYTHIKTTTTNTPYSKD